MEIVPTYELFPMFSNCLMFCCFCGFCDSLLILKTSCNNVVDVLYNFISLCLYEFLRAINFFHLVHNNLLPKVKLTVVSERHCAMTWLLQAGPLLR